MEQESYGQLQDKTQSRQTSNRCDMKLKPITPAIHGLIDYGFAAALMTIPGLIGCNRKTAGLYRGIAVEVFLYSTLTKHPAALWPLIPMKAHRLVDVANLSGLVALTAYQGIRKNPRAVAFNLGMVALGVTAVILTRWRGGDTN